MPSTDAIRSYAGLLGRFNLVDAPPSLEANEANVDMQGSSIQSFLTACDEHAFGMAAPSSWST